MLHDGHNIWAAHHKRAANGRVGRPHHTPIARRRHTPVVRRADWPKISLAASPWPASRLATEKSTKIPGELTQCGARLQCRSGASLPLVCASARTSVPLFCLFCLDTLLGMNEMRITCASFLPLSYDTDCLSPALRCDSVPLPQAPKVRIHSSPPTNRCPLCTTILPSIYLPCHRASPARAKSKCNHSQTLKPSSLLRLVSLCSRAHILS